MTCKLSLIFILLIIVAGSSAATAADWPRFRGPDGTGISPEKNLARAWPADGPRTLWTVDVGVGFGGAAVQGGEVYILDRIADKQDALRCLDLATGKELWRFAYDAPGALQYPGSRNVPTVQTDVVYTVGPFGDVYCIDRKSHRPVWSAHLVNDFHDPQIDRPEPPKTRAERLKRTQVPMWGVTQAPLFLNDGTMVLAPQTEKVGLVAYDKSTGKIIWRSPYIGRNWYSHVSPALVSLDGVEQIIMIAQPGDPEKSPDKAPPANVSSIDPKTGQRLWNIQTPKPFKIPIPQPVQIGPSRLFITGGLGFGFAVLQAQRRAGGEWDVRWESQSKLLASYAHSPIVWREHILAISGREHGGTTSGLVCLDLACNLRWQTGPKLQFDLGGFLIADDMAFVMHGRTGELFLFELSHDGFKQLARAKVLEAEGGQVWAPVALSEGKLIVRDQHQVKCLDVRGN